MLVLLLLGACRPSNAGAESLGYSGRHADQGLEGYDAAACVDISQEVPCFGEIVLVCCTADACAVGTSGGFSAACDGTNCDDAGDALADYCAGTDTGTTYYYTTY